MGINKINSYLVDQVLRQVCEARGKSDKIRILRDNNTLSLRNVLKGAFDDSIQFLLPEGAPPYREAAQETSPSTLKKQSSKFKYFVKGGPGESIAKLRVESMFVKLLESIPPSEAKVVILMKDKTLTSAFRGINKRIVEEAFPGLIAK
jgi:hypothetical protein